MSKTLVVTGALTVQEGKIDAVLAALHDLATATRQEAGNLEYLVMQDSGNPNAVFSVEKWETEAAEAAHWDMAHLKAAFEIIGPCLAGEPVVHKGYEI